MNSILTDWFPTNVKPRHEGVYMTTSGRGIGYSCWRNGEWSHEWATCERARKDPYRGRQDKQWRGLAEEPK